jgi:putative membrane protein
MQSSLLKSFTYLEWVAAAALVFLAFYYAQITGAFSRHMIIHIALMTVAAPVLAGLLLKLGYSSAKPGNVVTLTVVIILQSALFFAWHSPLGVGLAMGGLAGALLMQSTLLFSALWFWLTVFNQVSGHLWRAVIALLLTGKIFC